MKSLRLLLVASLLTAGLGAAASAQMSPGGMNGASPGGDMQAPKLQPKGSGEAPLPPAVPGASDQDLQTQQSVAKQQSGDPTEELFSAINANNYSLAQDAIGRGADINGQNALGESPIDLSVALNRTSITFMLLAARNDSGDSSVAGSASAPLPPVQSAALARHPAAAKPRAVPVKLIEKAPPPMNSNGTPDANAGFLGFNH